MARIEATKQIQKTIDDLWDDRIGFVKYIIGQTPTDQQGDALVTFDKNDHMSVASGHGCGKSSVQSWLILHYLCCRPSPKIPCTAPTKHQLHNVLWAELSKWHRQMQSVFAAPLEWSKEYMRHKSNPEEWFAAAVTASKDNPVALQGMHTDYVMKIIDEASGVPEAVFEVLEGAHGRFETKEAMFANPTALEGSFFESHHKMKKFYKRLQWSCLDSSIAPPGYAERMERKYGRESNIYRVRVLGLFPNAAGDSFIPYSLAAAALVREVAVQKGKPIVFGVDVARYGEDDSVLAIRQGDEFMPYHVLRNKSTMEVAGYVARQANVLKPEAIFVDVIGLGAGVFDRLEEQGYPVIGVNVAELPAIDSKKYKRLRDEVWGNMRDWLADMRGKIWDNEDQDLVGQLTSPKYHHTSDGKIVIETKDEMKKRGVSSPDIAEAHIMTFAQPIAEYTKEEDDFWDDIRGRTGYQPIDAEAGY